MSGSSPEAEADWRAYNWGLMLAKGLRQRWVENRQLFFGSNFTQTGIGTDKLVERSSTMHIKGNRQLQRIRSPQTTTRILPEKLFCFYMMGFDNTYDLE
jgi:hypothetical protein